ncbi:MAG: hypothetical protein BGO49_18475 [Planctomycetales bacterium 71-10]|nr:MAG: hypothetical protein BGO49_18475 [Planctomycetales bacterium 71-10]
MHESATAAPAAAPAEPADDPSLPPAAEADPIAAAEAMPDLPPAAEASPDLPPAAEAAPIAAEELPDLPPAAAAPTPAPAEEEDPLLGPSPELMPAIEPSAPAEKVPAKPEASPAAPLEAAPAVEAAPGPSAAAPAPRDDAMVRTVSTASAPPGADVDDSHWKEAGRAAARVGDEVITLRELRDAVQEAVRRQGGQPGQIPRDQINLVARHVLASLIERTLMVQEAKHQLKSSDKQLLKLQEVADKYWRENELPPLLRKHFVENEHQLRRKFDEEGRSLAAIQSNFRQEFVAHAFLMQKIGDRTEVGLPDMLKYYEEHKDDKTNHRSAAVVWREILVDKSKHATPAEARAKADALLARLRKGEDFAAVAAAESEGPARIKAAGGRMETAPGSYVVAAVNQALDSLPLNATSDVVEGPDSLHILRVESRHAGGPASFADLQDQIRAAVRERKMEEQRRALIASLRKKTVVTTMFDGTESDPNRVSD